MSPRQRWSALGVLAGSLLVVMMDSTIVIVALPDLVEDLQPTSTQQLWIVDIYSLIVAGMLIPMSALADRWGRKKILLIGFAIIGVVSLLVLVADDAGAVIGLRGIMGVGGAMVMPTTLSMIRTIFRDPKERATALAVWAIISGLGAIIGPMVGGALLDFFGWNAAFLINVPFVVVAIAAGLVLLPETRDPHPAPWDLVAVMLSIAGMAILVWGIKHLAREGWADAGALMALAIATFLLIWFVCRCLRRQDPLLDVRLFRSKTFTAGTVAALASMLSMGALMLLIAQWLQVVEGLSPLVAGVALLPIAVGSFIFAPFAPVLAIRVGARAVLAAGLAIAGLGQLLLFGFGNPLSYWQLALPMALVGAGAGSLAIASAIIMGSSPPEKAGHAAAIEESMYDLGIVLGVAVLGSLAAALYRHHLSIGDFANRGITGDLAVDSNESLVGALAASTKTGQPELGSTALDAFTESLVQTSLAGGLIMLAAAITVYLLVPRTFDIASHGDPETTTEAKHG